MSSCEVGMGAGVGASPPGEGLPSPFPRVPFPLPPKAFDVIESLLSAFPLVDVSGRVEVVPFSDEGSRDNCCVVLLALSAAARRSFRSSSMRSPRRASSWECRS